MFVLRKQALANGGIFDEEEMVKKAQWDEEEIAKVKARWGTIKEAAAARDVAAVVVLMRATAGVVELQREGCEAIKVLARNSNNLVAIAGAGGIRTLLGAMERHKDDVEVQQNGCNALNNLAFNNDNKVAIAGAGGIRSVVEAMGRHKDVAMVQEYGCTTLQNLAGNGKKYRIERLRNNGVNERGGNKF